MTFVAFLMAIVMIIQIHMQYKRMERMYATYDDDDYAADQEGEEGNPEDKEEDNNESLMYELLASTSSRSMTFVGIYTMMLALALNLYGSTAIVGFTSLRGVYIAPCFSTENSSMRVGMFGGAIVIFANLLLLCAVILGEFRVSTNRQKSTCYVTRSVPQSGSVDAHNIAYFPFRWRITGMIGTRRSLHPMRWRG